MLIDALIIALFLLLMAIFVLIALVTMNLGLYVWQWIDDRRLRSKPHSTSRHA